MSMQPIACNHYHIDNLSVQNLYAVFILEGGNKLKRNSRNIMQGRSQGTKSPGQAHVLSLKLRDCKQNGRPICYEKWSTYHRGIMVQNSLWHKKVNLKKFSPKQAQKGKRVIIL